MDRLIPAEDIDFILERAEADLWRWKGSRLFLTGATGVIGKWLLATIEAADQRWNLGIRVVALSRRPEKFKERHPQFSTYRSVHWTKGSIGSFEFPAGGFDGIIHGATEASASADIPREKMLSTQVGGMKRVITLARRAKVQDVLFLSSGAVYGRIPSETTHVSESFSGRLPAGDAYAEGKRQAEKLLLEASNAGYFQSKISRTFALVGPFLPLDRHYAIGNFLADGMAGRPIIVKGDGTPTRSYLYLAEHTVWLLRILARGVSGRAYNVGSEESKSIREVAEACGAYFKVPVEIEKKPRADAKPSRYVPKVERAKEELDLKVEISLATAIVRTASWLKGPK